MRRGGDRRRPQREGSRARRDPPPRRQHALVRYTGLEFPATDAKAWAGWLKENRDYLYFSDCEGFRFKVDEEAKEKRIPFEELRGWSSESIDYRPK